MLLLFHLCLFCVIVFILVYFVLYYAFINVFTKTKKEKGSRHNAWEEGFFLEKLRVENGVGRQA